MDKNIRDIAKEAGVSVATVSKVINGYPYVSDKTREKVQRVLRDTQFIPNSAARELVRKRSMTLGLLLTTGLKHPFVLNLLEGIEDALKATGYDLIYLVQTPGNKPGSFVRHCRSRNVEGVLLFGFQRHDQQLLNELIQAELPCVFVDLDLIGKRAGYVTSDNFRSIVSGVEYLYGLGHRRIGFLSGLLETYTGRVRFEAYKRALDDFGLPYVSEHVAVTDFTKESGSEGMKKLLAAERPPTAVLCSSDMSALGAIRAIQEAGLSVPSDISVMGFDDINLAEHMSPALTTIRQDAVLIGRRAVEMLVEMAQNPDYPPPSEQLATEIVVRDSCGPNPEAIEPS